jgi:hypothetical protein
LDFSDCNPQQKQQLSIVVNKVTPIAPRIIQKAKPKRSILIIHGFNATIDCSIRPYSVV